MTNEEIAKQQTAWLKNPMEFKYGESPTPEADAYFSRADAMRAIVKQLLDAKDEELTAQSARVAELEEENQKLRDVIEAHHPEKMCGLTVKEVLAIKFENEKLKSKFGKDENGEYILNDPDLIAELKDLRETLRALLVSAPRHKWSPDGERCEVCGAKDWMGGKCEARQESEEELRPMSERYFALMANPLISSEDVRWIMHEYIPALRGRIKGKGSA